MKSSGFTSFGPLTLYGSLTPLCCAGNLCQHSEWRCGRILHRTCPQLLIPSPTTRSSTPPTNTPSQPQIEKSRTKSRSVTVPLLGTACLFYKRAQNSRLVSDTLSKFLYVEIDPPSPLTSLSPSIAATATATAVGMTYPSSIPTRCVSGVAGLTIGFTVWWVMVSVLVAALSVRPSSAAFLPSDGLIDL
jgi:hypothetical protein